ncbi:nitrate- and nitrite sensing domain-containing protein [Streptomyces sp. P9(2023)]|uniref:sensor histidine kinase n=1 Tax=Streptomyces sp. P9(2023) TaxID=3064394 RepID=UPI0028F43D41|nr:nitrate- and nitrite sensing domain-containing protein [Streptomyces sp. P9(2023)]MDT9688108.1 nitrate- and nitrite sensing domain-containing protein [Streptomyces sp. P9(2023)]
MRAPVQKKRPRSNNGTRSQAPGDPQTTGDATGPGAVPGNGSTASVPVVPAPTGRPKRVRNRLVAGVALVGVTVLAAGAPAVLTASGELSDAQRLVTLAELDRQAVTLAHSLADERDEVVAYIAAGRDEQQGDTDDKRQITSTRSTRVDRQIDEIRPAAPAELRRDLAGLPSIRRTALTGKGTALEAHRAYTEVIAKLQALADELAEQTPARAADATRAPAALGRAVEQASAARGLLLAAFAVPQPKSTGVIYDPITGTYVPAKAEGADEAERTRDALTAAAQQARVRELAALADFDQAATTAGRDSLAATVAGPDVKKAESLLAKLTDQPQLTKSERRTDPEQLDAALSARIEQMRGVESSLAATRVDRLAQLRDDDVTALEVRIAYLGGFLLVAIGISTFVARTLTRPLAVLRIGAARLAAAPEPETEEPVRFTGRNDEFAQVVRSLNTLHGKLADLGRRAGRLDSERADLAGAREALGAELAAQRAELQGQTAVLTAELERLRHSVHHTFVNLSLRSLGLVERQLGVIEKLEEREQDPDRLATLFKLDHMATVMRRHSENLLVLAGHEHVHGHPGPVPLVDVLRAAVSEIERYERVTLQSLPPHAQIAGFAADDLSHLIAELLENATSFSPPDAQVQLSGWLLESGEVMLSVQDEGIGMTESRLAELNARLASADPADVEGEGLGIRVTALLAARHGVRVELRAQKQGGITAVVVLPLPLLPDAPPTAGPPAVPVAGAAPTLNLPGSVAEANSNTLPSRTRDPLVEAAERAIEAAVTEAAEAEAAEAAATVEEQAAEESAVDPTPERESDGGSEIADIGSNVQDHGSDIQNPESGPEFVDPAPEAPAAAEAPAAPQPSPAETTLQVRLPDPPPEPDAHERAREEGEPQPSAAAPRVTDKGLPKRTPKVVRQTGADMPAARSGGVDPEALRRRLGGFHRGAEEGRKDVEAEIEARTEEKTGETVEEARG